MHIKCIIACILLFIAGFLFGSFLFGTVGNVRAEQDVSAPITVSTQNIGHMDGYTLTAFMYDNTATAAKLDVMCMLASQPSYMTQRTIALSCVRMS